MEAVQFAACYSTLHRMGFDMLTLVKQENKDTKLAKKSVHQEGSNIVSFSSKARTNEKSQKNVLAAAKKLKW